MAGQLIWALEALDDIDAIARYIARDSAVHARRVVQEILELGELFLTQPLMGRVVPELANPAIREHFIYSYRVIYQVSGDDVHVLIIRAVAWGDERTPDAFVAWCGCAELRRSGVA